MSSPSPSSRSGSFFNLHMSRWRSPVRCRGVPPGRCYARGRGLLRAGSSTRVCSSPKSTARSDAAGEGPEVDGAPARSTAVLRHASVGSTAAPARSGSPTPPFEMRQASAPPLQRATGEDLAEPGHPASSSPASIPVSSYPNETNRIRLPNQSPSLASLLP